MLTIRFASFAISTTHWKYHSYTIQLDFNTIHNLFDLLEFV